MMTCTACGCGAGFLLQIGKVRVRSKSCKVLKNSKEFRKIMLNVSDDC